MVAPAAASISLSASVKGRWGRLGGPGPRIGFPAAQSRPSTQTRRRAGNESPPAGQPLGLAVPQRLTPPEQPEAQSPDAASPDARPGAVPVKPTGISGDQGPIEVAPLAPIDPDWAGPLTPDQGGFPLAMWQGTPQALVVAVVPRLAVTSSPVIQGLTKRLLLSNAIAPGPRPAARQSAEQPDLVELRIE